MIKRLSIVTALCVMLGIAIPAYSQQSSPLTTFDFSIVGLKLKISPEYQAVPKGITTQVIANFDTGSFNTADIINQLPKDYTIRAELTGPAFQTPLTLTARPGAPFDLPTLALLGTYTLNNIRLVNGEGTVLLSALPQSVMVESICDPLITSVTTRQLSLSELQERGVTFDTSNFTAYEFTAGIATQSGQVPMSLPVLIPNSTTIITNPEELPQPVQVGITPPSVNVQPPDMPSNVSVSGFMMQIEQGGSEEDEIPMPAMQLPPIPGVVMIPGNIGFLQKMKKTVARY